MEKLPGVYGQQEKTKKLNGLKLLLVEICTDETEDVRHSIVAADNAGAGNGDLVLVTTGSAARASTGDNTIPVDACIVGIIDSVERYG